MGVLHSWGEKKVRTELTECMNTTNVVVLKNSCSLCASVVCKENFSV